MLLPTRMDSVAVGLTCSRISASPPILARMSDSDPGARLNAALEGRYRIESELGEGGMATGYLADDVKHERKVALEVPGREASR